MKRWLADVSRQLLAISILLVREVVRCLSFVKSPRCGVKDPGVAFGYYPFFDFEGVSVVC